MNKIKHVLLIIPIIVMFIFCVESKAGENPCISPPVKDAQSAICYGKWYSRVVSSASLYGYEYTAQQNSNTWIVIIKEKSPGKTTTSVIIKESDGSLIKMNND